MKIEVVAGYYEWLVYVNDVFVYNMGDVSDLSLEETKECGYGVVSTLPDLIRDYKIFGDRDNISQEAIDILDTFTKEDWDEMEKCINDTLVGYYYGSEFV